MHNRLAMTAVLSAVLPALLHAPRALGQDRQAAAEAKYVAAVVEESALAYSGPYDTYYPFGRLAKGDLVQVIDEKGERWARVRLQGPAFRDFYGYVRHTSDEGKLRLSADGGSAVALDELDILAPNLNTKGNPMDSWKVLDRMRPGQRFAITETIPLERETVYKVALPDTAAGWVNLRALRRATTDEVARFEAAAAGRPATDEEAAVLARPEERAPKVAPAPAPTGEGAAAGPPALPPAAAVTPLRPGAEPAVRPATPAPAPQPAAETTAAAPQAETSGPIAEPGASPAPQPPPAPKLELEDLEEAYVRLRQDPAGTVEVEPLRALYLGLAERSTDNRHVARYARTRAEQLLIWKQLQERRQELAGLRTRIDAASAETEDVRLALERGSEYAGVGRLVASTIYDGKRLPLLLRLEDPATGRTVAYVRPSEQQTLVDLIGQLVGVNGEKILDEGLRLTVIDPVFNVDILAPHRAPTEG